MILVTGATGFLGAELTKQLTSNGTKLRAIKREQSIVPPIIAQNKQVEWFIADINEPESLADALEGITQVYHCAASVVFQQSKKQELFNTNIQATANLVDLCVEKNIRLLHVSSVAALGKPKRGCLTNEKDFWEYDAQAQNYALSKYRGEMEVWRGIAEGLNAIIVNPSIIIGKNAASSGSGALFKLVKNRNLFYTKGTNGFVDVQDVANCMIQLMNSDLQAERYIINAANLSYQELFNTASEALQVAKPRIEAKTWMLELAWRLGGLYTALSGKTLGLTKEIARSSRNKCEYSNNKIVQTLQYTFKPIQESIADSCLSLQP